MHNRMQAKRSLRLEHPQKTLALKGLNNLLVSFVVKKIFSVVKYKGYLMYKYLILIFSVVLVVSCTTSSSSGNASLTGTISLLNSDDHSGVTIALYNLAYLDTTLVRINQQYPHIGVIITQETEFDHRLQTPVKFTQTDMAGNFKLEGIRPGKYNLALLKEGYSLKYVYNIHLSEGSNTLSTPNSKSTSVSHCDSPHSVIASKAWQSTYQSEELVDETIFNSKLDNSSVVKNALNSSSVSSVSSVANMFYLYPSVLIPPVVSIPITFQTGVQYNFPQNTIITAPVTIEPGTILAVGVNRKIDFHSSISTPETGTRWWLTSAHSINSLPLDNSKFNTSCHYEHSAAIYNTKLNDFFFDRINIYSPSQINITNAKVTLINSGINITAPSTNIINSYFDHNANAIAINGGVIDISNILHKNSSDRSIYVTLEQTLPLNSIDFNNNISFSNLIALDLYEVEASITNNYFFANINASKSYRSTITISRNDFEKNNNTITILGGFTWLMNNRLFSCQSYFVLFSQGTGTRSNGVINNNNFLELNNYLFKIFPRFSSQSVISDIDAKNNYFKNLNLDHQIYDKHDDDRIDNEFIYIPRANNPIPNAGIQ